MTLYDIIYQWFNDNVFITSNTAVNNITYKFGDSQQTLSMLNWLSHTCTIITLLLLVLFLFFFVKWLFKLFAGLLSH